MAARGTVVGRARVLMDVDKRRFDRDMVDAEKTSHRTGRALQTALKAGAIGAGLALAGVGLAIRDVTRDAIDDEKQMKQTEAVLRSTGGTARVTARDISELSTKIALYSGLQDDVVQSGANMLLTFTNVRNEAGKGNDVYNQSLVVLADMSTALGTSMPKSAIQLGKALNDPIKGITALRRVGVTFTDAQKAQIEQLVKAGRTMDAQKLILAELRKEFGGSAKAAGETFAGQMSILHQRLQGVGQELLSGLIPAVDAAVDVLGDAVDFIDRIASAPSLEVGVDIALRGVKDFSQRIGSAISDAVGQVEWSSVGRQIGSEVGDAIEFSADALDRMLGGMFDWLDAHGTELAEFGAEMLVRMMLTLTDPVFWAKHWDLALLLMVSILVPGFGRLAVRATAALGSVLIRGMSRLGGEAAYAFMAGVARLPGALGDAIAAGVSLADNALRPLLKIVGRVAGFIRTEFGRIPGLFGRVFRFGIIATFFRLMLGAIDKVMGGISSLLGGLAKLPFGLGKPFERAQKSIDGARARIRDMKNELTGLKPKTVAVNVKLTASGASGARPGDGLVYTGEGPVSAWWNQALTMTAQQAFNAGLIVFPSLGGSTSATGLQPYIRDELAIGQAMGLRLTSGRRAPSRTSTGGWSLHGSGQAIDMGGSPGQMAAFARTVAGRSGIAEVIYTPVGAWYPGAGWTRPTGKLASDHFDHVHVGARSGDGIVGAYRPRFTGDGYGEDLPADLEPGELPRDIVEAIFNAEGTAQLTDDIAAYERAREFLIDQLEEILGREGGEWSEDRMAVGRALREVETKLEDLRKPAEEPTAEEPTDVPLPTDLRHALAYARLSEDRVQIVAALRRIAAFYEGALARQLNAEQRLSVSQELKAVRDEIAALEAPAAPSAELPAEIEERIFLAEDTPDFGDDVSALEEARAYLVGQLALATTAAERLPIRRALRDIDQRLAQARGRPELEKAALELAGRSLTSSYGSNLAPSSRGAPGAALLGGGSVATETPTTSRGVTVIQNFHKPPDDPFPLLRSARFAAEGVLG